MSDFVFDIAAVKAAMVERGVSQAALAEIVGLTHKSAVAKILNGTRQVKVGEASKIYDALRLVPVQHRTTQAVPLIGFTAAGSWREAIASPRGRVLIPNGIAGNRAFAVEVEGDSMNRIIAEGSWLVVDPDDKALVSKRIYLIQNDQFEVTVKRYMTDPARFEPDSTNDEHKPFLAGDCDFSILGRVIWQGGAL